MIIAKSISNFILAGLCEIGGGYLVYLWLWDALRRPIEGWLVGVSF